MKRNILWILLVIAPLVSASSVGGFEATCNSEAGCGGNYNGNTFSFGGPFLDVMVSDQYANSESYPYIEFGIGTNGGSFTSGGHTCDYDVTLGGLGCDGEIMMGAYLGPPEDTGLPLGDVVSVKGIGPAEGFFCWDCDGRPPPLFNVNVTATYQFTLTDPGTSLPFTWTSAEFSSVPEPGALALATLGLAGLAVGWGSRRFRSQRTPVDGLYRIVTR